MTSTALAAVLAGVLAATLGLYLARLTVSVPDRSMTRWWLGRPATTPRVWATGAVAVVLACLGGTAAGWSGSLPAFLTLALIAAPLVIIDIEHRRLPDRLVYAALASEAVLLAADAMVRADWPAYLRAAEAALFVYGLLLLLRRLAPPGALGLGDVKLGAALAAALGWVGWRQVYLGLALAPLLGLIVALALLVTRHADRRTQVPFGPMLILGAFLVLGCAPS